ncbi:MAG: bifunctional demethylmenaquinone methyltransferase/2-methoxy-6-polyprenyl-1,4-benzoquinol methylase UbiE [Pirellulales bacterium]
MSVDKSDARIRQMFGRIATRYDRLNHLLSLNIDRYWRWRTVRAVPPRGDAPILDLCTGTGDLALVYYRKGANGAPIVGADFCHEMLVLGRDKGRRAGADGRLVFVEADAQRLPFPDAYFQIVAVAFGLRNICDPDRALAEMVRVLRPGGRLAVLEFSLPTFRPLRALYGWYFQRVLPRIGRMFAGRGAEAYEYLPNSVVEFTADTSLAERMGHAGLAEVRVRSLTMGVVNLWIGTKPKQVTP